MRGRAKEDMGGANEGRGRHRTATRCISTSVAWADAATG